MRHIELRVLCEGQTELFFTTQVLQPHLRQYMVFATAALLWNGQGGIVPWQTLRNSIKNEVGRSRDHQYVTTMIDLYAIGNYPGVERQRGETPYDRTKRIEKNMAEGLPNPRFLPYVQIHEFEALVFVDLDYLTMPFPDGQAEGAPEKLRSLIGDTEPELVNDNVNTAPSKRLISIVPAYSKVKASAGAEITKAIGIHRLKEACPHFHEWVTQLEHLSEE
ncbi:MAG: uncharacterized protein JWN14_136 [Chthonomonadales bacterium]|nr:uncharacterized protein [Chthonomonadales bacterium]